jgi:branched-chain amino acid transport system ATP-binding protein
MSALAAEGLSLSFGALAVARDINLSLVEGERHALIGPNGAGKTTLVNLLTGLLRPQAGRILLDGRDITRLSPRRRVRLGLVRTFQINNLFPALTPLEAVVLAIAERKRLTQDWFGRLSRRAAEIAEAEALLARLGFGEDAKRPTRTLPYARQRLLEIALALAAEPRILLLDEPAAGVPAAESAELFAAIAALPRAVTILFIEHDMDLVFRFAERITVLVAGGILRQGSPAEIAADAQVREVYLGGAAHG